MEPEIEQTHRSVFDRAWELDLLSIFSLKSNL
jgi:hypothetical protein